MRLDTRGIMALVCVLGACGDDGSGPAQPGTGSGEATDVGSSGAPTSTSSSSSTRGPAGSDDATPGSESEATTADDDATTASSSGCTSDAQCDSGACDVQRGTCFAGIPIAVVVGYGTRRARSADGETWTDLQEVDANGGDDNNLLRGVGYGDGVFVAVGGGGQGLSLTSRDGIAWEHENRTISSFLADVVFFDGVFVAAGGNGLRVRSTDGGATWVDPAGYQQAHYRAIAAGDDRVVAVGHSYGGESQVGLSSTTTDGVAWSEPSPAGAALWAVAYGNGVFVAAGNGGRVAWSDDGQQWTDEDLGATENLRNVAFVAGRFYVATGGRYFTSTDGTGFRQEPYGNARGIYGVLRDASLSIGWPGAVFRSANLESWSEVFAPGGSGFTDIAVGVPGA